jgi:DNA replication protein DnaD
LVSSMAFLKDRREYPRYPVNIPIYIFCKGKVTVGHTLNVGPGGMKIYTDKILPSRQDILFQLVVQGEAIWIKGGFVFEQTQSESITFLCIKFEETSKECQLTLNEFLSKSENLNKEDLLNIEAQIREKEAELSKANKLLKFETERRERVEQALKDVVERLGCLSLEFWDYREKKIKITIQGLDNHIESLLLAINDGLRNIHFLLNEENVADQISFEQIIFRIENKYKEIRTVLENLRSLI